MKEQHKDPQCSKQRQPRCHKEKRIVIGNAGLHQRKGRETGAEFRAVVAVLSDPRQQGVEHTSKRGEKGEEHEDTTVSFANTIVDERTVMIQTDDTNVAAGAVHGRFGFVRETGGA